MNQLLAILAQQMNENLGNRLTPAVANGIILAIRQETELQEEAAKKPPDEGTKS